mgnify:CR=1 FL=1
MSKVQPEDLPELYKQWTLIERNRIINLLESDKAWWLIDTASSIEKQNTVEALIALIRGSVK